MRSDFSKTTWRKGIVLASLAFVVYNANLRSISSFDTNPTRYLPISIIQEFDLDLDEFSFLHKYPEWWPSHRGRLPYYIQHVRGHYMSTYPVMPAILSLPVYIVPVLLGLTDGPASKMGFTRTEIVGTVLSKISASAAVAFSVAVVYWTLSCLVNASSALWITLLYAFATSSWSVSSQGLWQTSMSQPLLAFSLYFLIKARENGQNAVYAGVPLALSVSCRLTNVLFAAVYALYVFRYYPPQFRRFIVFPVMLASLLLTYNYYYFTSVFGGYSNNSMGAFLLPRLEAFVGLLFSPSRGLLVYSPFLIFSVVGMGLALTSKRKSDPLLFHTAVASIMLVVLYSAWDDWHGAFSYSYRFLVELLPALSLFLAAIWPWIVARWWRRGIFASLAIFSLSLQFIGAFHYPCGWYETPAHAASQPSRFWDWNDPEFLRCLQAGPVEPDGLRFLRELIPH